MITVCAAAHHTANATERQPQLAHRVRPPAVSHRQNREGRQRDRQGRQRSARQQHGTDPNQGPGGVGWPYACPWLNGDINMDGRVDFDDIDPFVELLGS